MWYYLVQTEDPTIKLVAQRMGAREHDRQNNVKGPAVYLTGLAEVFGVCSAPQELFSEHLLGARQGTDNGFLKEVLLR
jgi:hypothetical protein